MAIEEKVIQPESVTNAEQPVAETASQPTQPGNKVYYVEPASKCF